MANNIRWVRLTTEGVNNNNNNPLPFQADNMYGNLAITVIGNEAVRAMFGSKQLQGVHFQFGGEKRMDADLGTDGNNYDHPIIAVFPAAAPAPVGGGGVIFWPTRATANPEPGMYGTPSFSLWELFFPWLGHSTKYIVPKPVPLPSATMQANAKLPASGSLLPGSPSSPSNRFELVPLSSSQP